MNAPEDGTLNNKGPTAVHIGTHVEVELLDESGGAEHMAFDIVPESAADFSKGFLGAGTPLARAILGEQPGRVVPYGLADIAAVRILSVVTSQRIPDDDAAAVRKAAVHEAVSKSNLEDAVRLALTVDVKWGDYDPEGIEPKGNDP